MDVDLWATDERELRAKKLTMRCGFCVRGECRFGPRCARLQRFAVVLAPVDSDYESGDASAEGDSNTDSRGGTTKVVRMTGVLMIGVAMARAG